MDRVSVMMLLLLFCSLSIAELQGNEILEQRSAFAQQPQPCPSDLHAVLRDMSAKLASLQTLSQEQAGRLVKNEFEIQKLQTVNQEQAAKLAKNELGIQELQTVNQEQAVGIKELQTLNQEQAVKLTVVDSLKLQQKEQATKLLELQTKTSEVGPIKEQLRGQAAELNRIKTQANVTENHVESLRRDRAVGRVAFSASLWDSGSGGVGPISPDTTLVFRHLISNFGNAYNSNTGVFTAPVRGVYHFEFHVLQLTSTSVKVMLVKNTETIVNAYEAQSGSYGTASNGATLLLEPGDVVFLRLWAGCRIYDDSSHFCSFSGRLMFLM